MTEAIMNNIQWVFSGIGVLAISGLVYLIRNRKKKDISIDTKIAKEVISEQQKSNPINPMIALFVITDFMMETILAVNYPDTYQEALLRTNLVYRLKERVLQYYSKASESLKTSNISFNPNEFNDSIRDFISLCHHQWPNIYTRSNIDFKIGDEAYSLWTAWKEFKESTFSKDSSTKSEFISLLHDEKKYCLLGFRDEDDYVEFLHPTIKSFDLSNNIHRESLRYILNNQMFSESDMLLYGFSKDVVIDLLNRLMRDSIIVEKNNQFSLSTVGESILTKLNNSKSTIEETID